MVAWAKLEMQGRWTQRDHELWHAALIEPVDCGERAATHPEWAAERKLRPIAQTETILKITESAAIDEELERLKAACEPSQLGVATPDGPVLAVKVLRGWLEDMEEEVSSPPGSRAGFEIIAQLALETHMGGSTATQR